MFLNYPQKQILGMPLTYSTLFGIKKNMSRFAFLIICLSPEELTRFFGLRNDLGYNTIAWVRACTTDLSGVAEMEEDISGTENVRFWADFKKFHLIRKRLLKMDIQTGH